MKHIHFESIDSTNKYLKSHQIELEDFTFASASYQTSGKGRYDRIWIANKNENLLFSILIKNPNLVAKYNVLSIGTAVYIAKFLEKTGLENVSIKWPNDVYVNDKKICGILLEGSLPTYIVIGIGLNVNQTQFLGDFNATPTSISLQMNKHYSVPKMFVDLAVYLNRKLNNINEDDIHTYVSSHNYLLGKTYEGKTIKTINKSFELVFEDDSAMSSGEISILK